MPSKIIRISGKVQGVFFRASAKEIADEIGIFGWTKNTSDGKVEIHAEGDAESLDRFIKWCKKGPKSAKVESIEIKDTERQYFETFEIII